MASKTRGLFERPPKSDVWWIQWFDGAGKRHREKAGAEATAIKLKAKRMTDKLESRKIPETLRGTREVRFQSLMDDALQNSIHENGKSAISNLKGMALAPPRLCVAARDAEK